MSRNTIGWGPAVERYVPYMLAAVMVAFGYVRFIQPNISEYVRLRGEVQTLDSRLKVLQGSTARGRLVKPVDEQDGLREFERRLPEEDKISEVVAKLVGAALDGVAPDKVRTLSVQTGESTQAAGTPGASSSQPSSSRIDAGAPDPRLALFPASLNHTPVTISFESSFEVIGEFLWRLRDMPTIVEIRSATLTRGLPLMKVGLTVFVYQRVGAPRGDRSGQPPLPAAPQPGAPRVAALLASEGWQP